MLRSIAYTIKQALRQTARNKTMMFTSLFSITAMMLILGLFLILAVNVNIMTESAEEEFDMVEIYLEDSVTKTEINDMESSIKSLDYVKSVDYVSKDKAMNIMKDRWGNNGYLLDGLSENPLPASLQVRLKNIEDADRLVRYAKTLDGAEDVAYRQDEINKILKITHTVQVGALIIIIFLVIVSIIVVANTIRLTVLARGREIRIMKYVGATNWFIRGPFLTEGMIIGIIAALISSAVVGGLYAAFVNSSAKRILVMFSMTLVPASYLAVNIVVIFLALGISIGAIGSIISMRRFLDT
ncbi:MAG: permease-like cell division protein FtsX [Eubacteriales bacterium]|nr:permease-like cell division protein FtsX [Eubacteriales bacterium]